MGLRSVKESDHAPRCPTPVARPAPAEPTGQAAALSVCTEASPEGFDVVQYNSLTTTNASADVLMNRLVDFDTASGKVVASLADSWEVSTDGLTYVFKLHPQVKFHRTEYFKPTRDLTAEDVKFSFDRMLDPANPWHKVAQSGFPHAQSMQLPALIKKIDALDPLTVRFTLDHPDSTFLATLSMGFASIYSAEYADKLMKAGTPEKLNSQPIGTGPFVFTRFQKDAVGSLQGQPRLLRRQTCGRSADLRHHPGRQRAPAEIAPQRVPDRPVAQAAGRTGRAERADTESRKD